MTHIEEKEMHDKGKNSKITDDDLDDDTISQYLDNDKLERKKSLVKWLLVFGALIILGIIMLIEYLFGN